LKGLKVSILSEPKELLDKSKIFKLLKLHSDNISIEFILFLNKSNSVKFSNLHLDKGSIFSNSFSAKFKI